MDRGNTIVAYLALAFLVFITMRGSLRTYMGFLIPAADQNPSYGTASNSSNAVVSQAINLAVAGG